MKALTSLILICSLAASFTCKEDFKLNGEWQLSLVQINSDTIFFRGDTEYTYRYSWKRHQGQPQTKEDSIAILNRLKLVYDNCMEIEIRFYQDSLFQMTKLRSGGEIYPEEFDSGIYSVSQDTLLMNNQSRENAKWILRMQQHSNKLYLKDGLPDYMIYQEFIRKKI